MLPGENPAARDYGAQVPRHSNAVHCAVLVPQRLPLTVGWAPTRAATGTLMVTVDVRSVARFGNVSKLLIRQFWCVCPAMRLLAIAAELRWVAAYYRDLLTDSGRCRRRRNLLLATSSARHLWLNEWYAAHTPPYGAGLRVGNNNSTGSRRLIQIDVVFIP